MNAAPRIKRPGLLGLLAAASAAVVLAACVSLINLAASMEARVSASSGQGVAAVLKSQR